MATHFEELWELCEQFHKESNLHGSTQSLLDELAMKINLYRLVDSKEIEESEKQKAKSRLCGEILLTLTNLSLTDNINVFDSLMTAHKMRSIDFYNKKYQ